MESFNVMKKFIAYLFLCLILCGCDAFAKKTITYSDVFVAGENGIHAYRIPSVIKVPDGNLLAFCEARKESTRDCSPTDMVYKISEDDGDSWSEMKYLLKGRKGSVTNPTPVVDLATNTLWVFFNQTPANLDEHSVEAGVAGNTCTVWAMKSTDNGKSWSSPQNITKQTKKQSWTSIAIGPGIAIQTKDGTIVVPANHAPRPWNSFVFYSTDHGKTWSIGEDIAPNTNECQVVELSDGRLMMNMRSYRGPKCRAVAESGDKGKTWSDVRDDLSLVDPVCQGSIVSAVLDSRECLLFSNPNSAKSRTNLTVRLSLDDGKSWAFSRVIDEGLSAYSCLVPIDDKRVGCLYEEGVGKSWGKSVRRITFAKFELDWLTGGKSLQN